MQIKGLREGLSVFMSQLKYKVIHVSRDLKICIKKDSNIYNFILTK